MDAEDTSQGGPGRPAKLRVGAVYLATAYLFGVPPFGTMSFPFRTAEGTPRMVTIVHGGGGVGKTVLLHVLASTRPGHAIVLGSSSAQGSEGTPPHAVCEWALGQDDPQRPHVLTVTTPNVRVAGDDQATTLLRREQGLFDRRARSSGFVFLALSSARGFSRQPVALHAPLRTVTQYDVRATANLDDGTRQDLTRDVKQALAYASIASALVPQSQRERNRMRARSASEGRHDDLRVLGTAMHEMVDALVSLVGLRYVGLDPASLEPTFTTASGRPIPFDRLPSGARNLVAFAALPIRTLWAAYPGRDPRECEGVVAIDEVELHQDATVLDQLVPTLRRLMPRIQWILTTTSPSVAASCHTDDILALRRVPEDERVELFVGTTARTH
jgi:hypothetical protein